MNARMTIITAGVLLAIGSALPWATLGFLSVPGTQGDGQITLILGIAAAAIGLGSAKPRKGAGIATVLISWMAAGIGLYAYTNLSTLETEATILGTPAVGAGLYLVLISAVAVFWGGAELYREAREAEAAESLNLMAPVE